MKRLQIGMRLIMLVVTLLGAVFAWLGALRSRQVADQAIVQMNLDAELRSQERWRTILISQFRIAMSPSHRGSVTSQIPAVDARIAELKSQLASAP